MPELCFNCGHREASHTYLGTNTNGLVGFDECRGERNKCDCSQYLTHEDVYAL